MSVPILSGKLRPLDDEERSTWDERLQQLAAFEGLELEEAPRPTEEDASAKELVQLELCTLGGGQHTAQAPRAAAVADLLAIAAAAVGGQEEDLSIILGARVLEDRSVQPLLDATDAAPVRLTLLRRPRIERVIFDSSQGPEQFEDRGRLSICAHGFRTDWRHLTECLAQCGGSVVNLSIRTWPKAWASQLPHFLGFVEALRGLSALQTLDLSGSPLPNSDAGLLRGKLPPGLIELDLSECWNHSLGLAMSELYPFAQQVGLLLQDLPHLRVLRLRGLDRMALEIDVRDTVLRSLGPSCAVQFG